jgi:hypothetical protein
MIYRALKYPLRIVRQKYINWRTYQFVSDRSSQPNDAEFNFNTLKDRTLKFVDSLKTDERGVQFKYSHSAERSTLYASAYACMTYSLFGKLGELSEDTKKDWVAYFDSFQGADGLFYDPAVKNEHFDDSDWWGARHLAVHMISAYTQLGSRPRLPFGFLKPFYDLKFLEEFFVKNEKFFSGGMDNDFDNKIMNIVSVLQYQRDYWDDVEAGRAVRFIQDYLLSKINPATGIWGDSEVNTRELRSRKVQFAYHLFPLFWYDNIYDFDFNKITELTLQTQNKFGGFGVKPNSSACDDIDSVDILVRFAKLANRFDDRVKQSLQNGMKWNLLNQVDDGGFVFRLNEPFTYGHEQLSSKRNQGAIFPTWFRTLNMAYLCKGLGIESGFKITRCPGYEF